MFDQNEYIKLINSLQNGITIIYIVILIIAVLTGIASGIVTLIITIPLGLLIAYCTTFATKVKIQEMKWRVDMYNKTDMFNKNLIS